MVSTTYTLHFRLSRFICQNVGTFRKRPATRGASLFLARADLDKAEGESVGMGGKLKELAQPSISEK